nr:hypothetical protein [Tanacetum cinerariifolium]
MMVFFSSTVHKGSLLFPYEICRSQRTHKCYQSQVDDDIVADDVATDDVADEVADVVAEDTAEPTPPSPTPAITPPPSQELPSTSQVVPTPPPSPIVQPSSPPPQQQPSKTTDISMDLLNTLLETYTTLTRKVEALEQDKLDQALEITKLKQWVRRLEKKNKLKVFGLRRLKKVGTAQRVESSTDTRKFAAITKGDEVAERDADVQGRQEESQAQVYHIDLEHVDKVLSMQDDEPEPTELKEVIEVVTTANLITEVVTAVATTITAALITAAHSMSYDDIRPIFKKHFNSIVGFLEKEEEQLEEEASKALKKKSESSEQQAVKKQKFDKEMILLVERRYPLTRFTLDQMLNNVRLEVEEKSKVSLELLRFVRRQHLEGYRPDFIVDVVEDFKEYTLRDYYCWLKTYCCWYKLKLLDNAADSRLRLLEESAAADDKMKK